MRTARTVLTAAAALVAALTLAGCTTGQQNQTEEPPAASSPATEAVFNEADVMFAQMMIPHHEQAIEMSDSLLEKDGVDEQVADLAQQIKDAQQPEIDQMKDWLDAWGEDELGDMGGMDHDMGDMGGMGDGMMSDEDMAQLDNASGAEASRLFLEQMILHHEGAIQMAESQVLEGENPDAVALAERIVEDQTEEIATMQDLLATL